MKYTKEEIQEYIDGLKFSELTSHDYVEEILSKELSKENVSEIKKFFEKIQNFLSELCERIKENIQYAVETSPVIQTFKQELQVLWSKVSPEIRNILISSAQIVKFVSCFIINSHQYLVNVICDMRKNTVIIISDLFCLVVNGIFKPTVA